MSLPFQKAVQPKSDNVGSTLCPNNHAIPLTLKQYCGSDPFTCPRCGWHSQHSFGQEQAQAQASRLTNLELELGVEPIDQSKYWESS